MHQALSSSRSIRGKSAAQTQAAPVSTGVSFGAIAFGPLAPYILAVGQPTMAINGLWNKRCGPGGGTRRLHQFAGSGIRFGAGLCGGEIGSTRVVKTRTVARYDTAVIGSKLSCER